MRCASLIFGAVVILLAADCPLSAQYPGGGYPPGSYPPGGYPPGGYPNGGGMGIPMPRLPGRNKKKTSTQNDTTPLQSTSGMLRRLDDKSVVLEAEDTRIIEFKRTGDTKFLKNGDPIKPGLLNPGDHVFIDARKDDDGVLRAVNVNFQKEGTLEERAKASEPVELPAQSASKSGDRDDDRPVLRRKDSPPADKDSEQEATPAPRAETAANSAPPRRSPQAPPPPDEDAPQDKDLDLDHIHQSSNSQVPLDESDSGAPRLQRGKQTPRKSSAPTQVAANTPPPAAGSRPEANPANEGITYTPITLDPIVEKARMAVAAFDETLPNYVCQEMMARFMSTTRNVSWQPQDVVSMEVIYDKTGEHYRNMAINGKAVKKNIQELSGAWSTGEFGSALVDLFSPATAADFRHRRDARSGGRTASVYDFEVDHDHSHWHVSVPGQAVRPAYRGSVWIDKETQRVLRIEMDARRLPAEFPMDKVESATDYEYIRIGDGQFLLPVHSESLSCQRGTDVCSRNVIDFRNYHKYSGEATITFDK